MDKIPRHVFISYSRKDKEFIDRLLPSFKQSNIPYWIDKEGLKLGTPDWKIAIGEAIDNAFSVVLIASPSSKNSDPVNMEISIAQSMGIPIIPVWINGTEWNECIPIQLINTQHLDSRDSDAHEKSLESLISALQEEMKNQIPDYYMDEFIVSSARHTYETPIGFVSIFDSDGGIINIRPSIYSNFQTFLDDLFTHFLKHRYKPFSYGKEWVLISKEHNIREVFVPIEWLRDDYTHTDFFNWANNLSPQQVGISSEMQIYILENPKKADYYGIASNEPKLINQIHKEAKLVHRLKDRLEQSDANLVTLSNYKLKKVLIDIFGEVKGVILTDKDIIGSEPTQDKKKLTLRFIDEADIKE